MTKFGLLRNTMDAMEEDRASGFGEFTLLSDGEKEDLCLTLLEEFGATNITVRDNGEIVHSCVLPFGMHAHGDRSPSASLNYRKLTYSCFGCGGGGITWFIGACRGSGVAEARRWLRDQTGSGPDEVPLKTLLDFFDAVYQRDTQIEPPLPHYDRRVLDQWLCIHPYLTEVRKIPEANLKANLVGYGRLRLRVGESLVESDRIVIPHFWKGDLVGWQSRRLVSDGTAKYQSSPDFPKNTTLYNHDRSRRTAVVVESPMSVLRHCHHQPMVATFGASVTDRQIKALTNHERVILWMDQDKAGWRGTEVVAEALAPYMGEVWVVECPWSADPADMDDDTVDRLIAEAVPYSLWTPPEALTPWEDPC